MVATDRLPRGQLASPVLNIVLKMGTSAYKLGQASVLSDLFRLVVPTVLAGILVLKASFFEISPIAF